MRWAGQNLAPLTWLRELWDGIKVGLNILLSLVVCVALGFGALAVAALIIKLFGGLY